MSLPNPPSLKTIAVSVAFCAALLRADATVASDGSACDALVVETIVIRGCEAADCDAFQSIDRIVGATKGEALSESAMRRTEARLLATRLVTRASLGCDRSSAALLVDVDPATFIRRVDVEGQDAFRRKDLLKRVFLRSGTPIELDDGPLIAAVRANSQVKRQLESLARLYDQAGLDDTRIAVYATRVSQTRIDLLFRIEEGLRERIDTVSATHVHRGGPETQCPTISDARLERLIGLGAGDLLTRNTEKQIRTRLRKAFQSQGFENPDIGIGIVRPASGGSAVVNVRVETGRCWLIRVWSRDVPARGAPDTLAWRWVDDLPVTLSDGLSRGDAAWKREPVVDWEGALPFGESGSFDRSEAARALDALTRECRARGYPFAEVRMVHQENVGASTPPSTEGGDVHGTIDFLLTFHGQRRIQQIRFEGNAELGDKLLFERLKTRPYGFFSGAGIFDEARLFADLGAIESRYRDEGYFRLRFRDGGPEAGGEFVREPVVSTPSDNLRSWRYRVGTRGFRVEMAAHERDLNIVIAIDEGAPLRVDELEFKGFESLERSELIPFFGFGPGDPFKPRLVDEAVARIEKAYRARGHHRFQVQVTCVAPPDAVAIFGGDERDCRDPDLRALEHVVVRVTANEGRPARVGAVVWRGQNLTSPHVLTRDFPKSGELLDLDRVNQGLRLMRTLPVFNSVRVDIIAPDTAEPDGNQTDKVDLIVAVEESETRFLDIAAGLRSIQRANIGRIPRWAANGTGLLVDQTDRLTGGFGRPFALDLPDILLTLELEYLDLHVGGDGGQLRIPFVAGFSLSEFLRLASFNPSYSWRRFLDTRMILTVRGIAELDRVTDPLDRLELGAESDLLLPIGTNMLAGFSARAGVIRLAVPDQPCINCLTAPPFGFGTALPQSLSEATARDAFCGGDAADPACNDGGFRPQFSVGARWRFDTLDTPLHPTRGLMLTAATSFILDRDRFALEPRFNQFFKWEASIRGAIPLGDFILAAFARYGGSVTFDQAFLPPDERFTLGGFNGLRGFSDNGICRYDRNGNLEADCPSEFGGNVIVNGSVELRAPLLQSVGLWLGLFMDFGALARSHETLYAASFRASTGLGLRWLLGNLIPVRVDLGFPLFARRCISVTETGECIREEPSAFHIDLLYPF